MQSPVIVLGMHRSGTSLLTGCLQSAGLNLGDVNDAARFNAKGNKENASIRLFHEQILHRNGLDWKRPDGHPLVWSDEERLQLLKLLDPYLKVNERWGVKDPRVVWFLDEWLGLFPQARCIAVFRHPMLVARSLSVRKGKLAISIEDGLELWYATNKKILASKKELDFPLLHFSETTQLHDTFFKPLKKFCTNAGLHSDPTTFFDTQLVNQTNPGAKLPEKVSELYDALIEERATG